MSEFGFDAVTLLASIIHKGSTVYVWSTKHPAIVGGLDSRGVYVVLLPVPPEPFEPVRKGASEPPVGPWFVPWKDVSL